MHGILPLESQLSLVKNNGCNISLIRNPFKETQIEAVRQNGYAIQYIENPCDEAKSIAINEFLKSVNTTSEECIELLKNNI